MSFPVVGSEPETCRQGSEGNVVTQDFLLCGTEKSLEGSDRTEYSAQSGCFYNKSSALETLTKKTENSKIKI